MNLDIAPWAGVDVVGSGLRLPFADESFSAVWTEAVLEHVRDPVQVVKEMYRVLRPGGWAYVEVPFLQHFHAWPNDYQRWTTEGLKVFVGACGDWRLERIGVCVGPCSAITALLADWIELLFWWGGRRTLVSDLSRLLVLVPLFPLKYLDILLARHPRAHEVASGLYLLLRKPG